MAAAACEIGLSGLEPSLQVKKVNGNVVEGCAEALALPCWLRREGLSLSAL